MAESISIPCSHIQNLIDEMAPSEVSSRLEELKFMLLKIQRGEDHITTRSYLHLDNFIRHFAYQIDDQLDTVYINIKSLERWAKSGISNVLKTLAIAYHKSKVLQSIRSLIHLVEKSKSNRSQTSDSEQWNRSVNLSPNFNHGYDYILEQWRSVKLSPNFNPDCDYILKDFKEVYSKLDSRNVMVEDGWKVLQSIAFPDHQKEHLIHSELKEIGMSLVRKCNGVPREIARIGFLLRENYSTHDWEGVRRTLGRMTGTSFHWNILDLSYDHLPIDLKACFLYFGLFWEDEDISAETVYQMWMAEGMVLPCLLDKRETIMDIAEDNLTILANMFLIDVQESEFSTLRKFVSCRIDKMVKEFCPRPKPLVPNDFQIESGTSLCFKSISEDGCRLSLRFNFFSHGLRYFLTNQLQDFFANQLRDRSVVETELAHTLGEVFNELRSLLIQKKKGVPTIKVSFPIEIYKKFKLLRVLKIENFEIHCGKLPKDIRNLIHLRFLSLEGSTLEELPKTLGNFRFMQTLDLRVAETIPRGIIVPDVLWKLKELRHLYLPTCHRLPKGKEKLVLSGLNKLETLVNFDTQKVELTSLEWKNLRNIDARVHGKSNICDIIACINESGDNLKETFLRANLSGSSYGESDVPFEDVFNCSKLNHFMVNWGRWDLINEFKIPSPFSSNVIELCLTRCQIKEDPMPILGKFPTLKKLVLGRKTFMGTCMIFEERSFQTLRYLKIQSLMHLERLEMQPNTLPNLFCLEIIYCIRLRMIPAGLIFIERLNELKLSMPVEFNDRIRRGEDVDKIQHVPHIFLEDW